MAPALVEEAVSLATRQVYCSRYYYYDYRTGRCIRNTSAWNSWGRWVALVCIVGFFLFVAFFFSCINARRRRRRGVSPMYGTGWLGGKQGHYAHNTNQNNVNSGYNMDHQQAVPPYSPPHTQQPQYTGTTFNQNDGYYGQQSGIQQPQNTYFPNQGAQTNEMYAPPPGPPPTTYAPPPGPPPGKTGY